jgi:adenine-specific DNA-methyltransferase
LHTPLVNKSVSGRSLGFVPTPFEIVQRMVELAAPSVDPSAVLEPACGDGRFLRCFRKKFGSQHRLVGVEIKPHRSEPWLIKADFLLWDPDEEFDIVIGNPPYGIVGDGSHYPIDVLKDRKDEYKRRICTWHGKYNLYGAFIEKSVNLLSPGGRLVFIVPTTWLVLDDFVLLRRFLAQRGGLEVFYVGRVFPKENVSCVILRFTLGGRGLWLYDWTGCLGEPKLVLHKESYDGGLIRFETPEWLAFEQSGIPLGTLFQIHFAARSPEFRRSGLVVSSPCEGYVPVLTGRNLKSGWIDYERCHSGWWMRREDAVRLRKFYGEPHLVVGHTKGARLVCAVDWRCYPWREEYHLIPSDGVQVDWSALERYLNSEQIQEYLQSLYRDLVPHLTKTMLAKVPIPEDGVVQQRKLFRRNRRKENQNPIGDLTFLSSMGYNQARGGENDS